jgi:hypothetical protein
MTQRRRYRPGQVLRSLRKETPGALVDPDSHDDAEVAAMLREIGIALGNLIGWSLFHPSVRAGRISRRTQSAEPTLRADGGPL